MATVPLPTDTPLDLPTNVVPFPQRTPIPQKSLGDLAEELAGAPNGYAKLALVAWARGYEQALVDRGVG